LLAIGRNRAQHGARLAVERCVAALSSRSERLSSSGGHGLATAEQRLGQQRAMLAAFDPRRQLERGWSLTRLEGGAIVRSVQDVTPGSRLVTTVADGRLRSVAEGQELAGQSPGATPEERT
jgi:exonuclease VII large subunit